MNKLVSCEKVMNILQMLRVMASFIFARLSGKVLTLFNIYMSADVNVTAGYWSREYFYLSADVNVEAGYWSREYFYVSDDVNVEAGYWLREYFYLSADVNVEAGYLFREYFYCQLM